MAFTGQEPQSHNSISRFRSENLATCIENLFNQFIRNLGKLNEIKFKKIFIDRTKIEAYANRYSLVWAKATAKFEAKLQEKTRKILEIINNDFELKIKSNDDKVVVSDIKNILDKLYIIKEKENITFVYGKGKRKSKLQKYIEQLEEFID